ncbi:MAG: hypothetical protein U0894_09855 [Pirellulales bacterium]
MTKARQGSIVPQRETYRFYAESMQAFRSGCPAFGATLGDIQDGVGFRRTRLQAIGKVTEFTNYGLEMDLLRQGVKLHGCGKEQTNVPFFRDIRVSHYRQPASTSGLLDAVRQLEFSRTLLPFRPLILPPCWCNGL